MPSTRSCLVGELGMLRTRIIPCLLLRNNGFVKTLNFKDAIYLGDSINILRIFNDKEVDEIFLLDIDATRENRPPNLSLLYDLASECFMPAAYGGGITNVREIQQLFSTGFEKVVLNSAAISNPSLVAQAADAFGSQSITVSIDVKKNLWGRYEVYTHDGLRNTKQDPIKVALRMEREGAGEILLNSIDRDGTMKGYDITLTKKVAESLGVPVVCCGGAGTPADLHAAVREAGVSGVAAGSMFVFQGKYRAVLINMPNDEELTQAGLVRG